MCGRPDRGLRAQRRSQRRRQRPAVVRPGAGAQRRTAGPLRYGRARRRLQQSHRERDQAVLHHAGNPGVGAGQRIRRGVKRRQARAHDRHPLWVDAPTVPRRQQRSGGDHPRLPAASAAAPSGPGHDLRNALCPGGAGRFAAQGGGWGQCRRVGTASARDAGGGSQSGLDLAHDADHPDLPRSLRRRRLPDRQPPHRAESGHRRLHHLRR